MKVTGIDLVPTRSVLLELRQEQKFVREGHDVLDHKRMLVAAETLRWLEAFTRLEEAFQRCHDRASMALAEAVARHGMVGLASQPARPATLEGLDGAPASFLGIPIVPTAPVSVASAEERAAVNPSPEVVRCRKRYVELLSCAAQLSVVSGNLHRLLREYRRTERKARALEDVILPELDHAVKAIGDKLDEQDREEVVRVRRRKSD